MVEPKKEKKKQKKTITLVERVNEAITKGELNKTHAPHYISIAEGLDAYTKKVDEYSKDLTEKVGVKHKTPDELYLALVKHVAKEAKIKNAEQIKKPEDIYNRKIISDEDLTNIRRHLNITYGIPNESDLRKLLDVVSGNEYESQKEVKEAIESLAHQRGRHEFSQKISLLTSQKEWPKDVTPEGSHTKFMGIVVNHYNPDAGKLEIDTYKTPEQALSLIGSMAEKAYETSKKARRKV